MILSLRLSENNETVLCNYMKLSCKYSSNYAFVANCGCDVMKKSQWISSLWPIWRDTTANKQSKSGQSVRLIQTITAQNSDQRQLGPRLASTFAVGVRTPRALSKHKALILRVGAAG